MLSIGPHLRVKESKCTACGMKADGATCIEGNHAPSAGDVTVCVKCGHIMAFDTDLMLRELTNKEMIEIAGDPSILLIQNARKRGLGRRSEK